MPRIYTLPRPALRKLTEEERWELLAKLQSFAGSLALERKIDREMEKLREASSRKPFDRRSYRARH